MQISAIVVEDDPLTRVSLTGALKNAGVQVIGEAGSASDAISLSKQLKPEVAFLDLHLGTGPTGVDVAHAFRRQDPAIGIIFLTSYEDPRLLRANLPPLPGGSIYLRKQSVTGMHVLENAIKDSLRQVRESTIAAQPTRVSALTSVQIETLKLVAQGLSNSEIAKRRFVKESSVEVTITRMAKALGMPQDAATNNRVHLANVYFRAIGMNPND
jgi:DNA-binding NarL/FixJ family response regulator